MVDMHRVHQMTATVFEGDDLAVVLRTVADYIASQTIPVWDITTEHDDDHWWITVYQTTMTACA